MEKKQPTDHDAGDPGSGAAIPPEDQEGWLGDHEAGMLVRALHKGGSRLATLVFIVFAILALLVALVVIPAVSDRGNDTSASIGAAGTEPQTQVALESAPAPPQESLGAPSPEADAGGPLSGTWSMWWTNSLGDESVGLTLRFVGVDSGTVEILNDESESETSFEVDGDAVDIRFTRLVSKERDVHERSRWQGTFTSGGEVDGKWYREDWACPPPPGACQIGPGFGAGFDSRLVREG